MKTDSTHLRHLSPELIAYYLTLTAFFVASFFPQYRVWGISWWAYFPIWVKLGLLTVGVAAPLAVDRLLSRTLADKDDISPKTYRWLAGGFVVVMLALFYLLRARTYFLGDGYTLISLMTGETHLIKPREYGGTIFQYLIYKLLGSRGEPDAILAYQLISFAAGIMFLAAAIWAASKLFIQYLDRLMFILGVCTGGYMLLYFGYIENYAFFIASVFLFTVTALQVAHGWLSRYWLVPAVAASIFFHIFGVVLIPVTLLLVLHHSPARIWILTRPRSVKILLGACVVAVLGTAFGYLYGHWFFFRLAILPIVHDQFTVGGYTMLSSDHLADFFNLIVMVFPGIAVALVALCRGLLRRVQPGLPTIAACGVALSCLGAALVFDPKLGMPRDWDLFCFVGIPLVLVAPLLVWESPWRRRAFFHAALLIILNTLVLAPRVMAMTQPTYSLNCAKSYARLDPARSTPLWFLIVNYYEQNGDSSQVRTSAEEWDRGDPDGLLINSWLPGQQGDTAAWEQAVRREVTRNPSSWTAWGNLGHVYLLSAQYDSALYALHIAISLNEINVANLSNLAYCHYYLGEYQLAEQRWLEARRLDSSAIEPLVGLSKLYQRTGDKQKYSEVFEKIVSRPDAPPEYLKVLGDYYLTAHRYPEAAATYKRAALNGMAPGILDSLQERHPELKLQ